MHLNSINDITGFIVSMRRIRKVREALTLCTAEMQK
jgi:hypothetical protein